MVFHYARASIPNLCSRILTRQVAECRLLAIYVLTTLFRCSQSHDAMIAFLDRARAYTRLHNTHHVSRSSSAHKFVSFSTGKFVTYIIDNLRSSLKLDYRDISSRTRSFRTSKHNSNNDTIRHTVREISLIFSRKGVHEITRSCTKKKICDKKFGRRGRLTTGMCARANERDHLRRL